MAEARDGATANGGPDGGAPKLGVPTKIAYGFGSVAFGVKDNGFRTFLLLFYNQVVGLPASTVSIAILVAMVFDAFLDPVIGYLSDNLHSRWGRRHPFMYAAAAPAALSYMLLWNPPIGAAQPVLIAWLIGVAVLSRTFITLFEIPSSSLAAELTTDYDQRTSIMSYRVFFAWWGGLTLTVLAYKIWLQPNAHYAVGQLNRDGYSTYGLVAAATMFTAIILSALGTHRRIPWLRSPPPRRRLSLRAGAREVFQTLWNGPFLVIAGVAIFAAAAEGAGFVLSLYFMTYFWGLSGDQSGTLVMAAFIGSLVAFILAPQISRRGGKKGAAMGLLVVAILLTSGPFILRLLNVFPPNGSPLLLPILFGNSVLTASIGITCSILIVSMIADVAEDSQLKTGRRNEGVIFSAMSFIGKAVSGLGAAIVGVILTVVHFPAKADPAHMDPAVLRNLAIAYLIMLFSLYSVTLVLLSLYRITRGSHRETLDKLALIEAAVEHEVVGAPR
jgi:GPH family glycoside/pentoside/hexuronide:cation symporter